MNFLLGLYSTDKFSNKAKVAKQLYPAMQIDILFKESVKLSLDNV